MTNEELNATLRRLKPMFAEKYLKEEWDKYMSHLLEGYQRSLEQEMDMTKMQRAQGSIAVIRKILDLPRAVKDVE